MRMTLFDTTEQSKFTLYEIKLKKDTRKSFVWQHFAIICLRNQTENVMTSIMCTVYRVLTTGSSRCTKIPLDTGNLSQHLRDAHGILLTRVLRGWRFIQTIAFVRLKN
jgi:hypothetical protein